MLPKVSAIPQTKPFLETLAEILLSEYAEDNLSRARILLPNRRSCRTLSHLLLSRSRKNALILPDIRAMGDLDEWELPGCVPAGGRLHALSSRAQELLLTNEVFDWQRTYKSEQIATTDEAALNLAKTIRELLDHCDRHALPYEQLFKAMQPLGDSPYASLFTHLIKFWQTYANENKQYSQIAYRNALVDAQIKAWQEEPPDYPVIAAGSTASGNATSRLLDTIAYLEQGRVIFPLCIPENQDWSTITEGHPYATIKQWLESKECEKNMSEIAHGDKKNQLIQHLFQSRASDTQHYAPLTQALNNIHLINAENAHHEAMVSAMLLRDALHHKQRAALVTTNRMLAGSVREYLKRWDIHIDDSAGVPITSLPAITLIRHLIAYANQSSPINLLSLLKHPLCYMDRTRQEVLVSARYIERT